MSISRFRYFETVARLGTIREAADVLHVAPSAISRQIAHLEGDFGVDLFERQGRGIRLTPAGHILLRYARGLLDGIEHAHAAIDDLQGLRRGHIRIWSVEGMIADFVAPTLAEFWERHLAVTVELVVASSDRVCTALVEDEADIGVTFNPLPHRSIAVAAQIADPLFAVLHPRHPAAGKKRLTLAEIMRWPLAIPDQSFGLRHLVDAAARAAQLDLQPTLVTNSIEALRGFARSGIGVTILPRLAIQRDETESLLKSIPLMDRALRSARVKICTRRERKLPAAPAELADLFKEAAHRSAP